MMNEKEKLIITLWRGQIDNPSKYQSVSCKLNYNNQEQSSQAIPAGKSLAWKQTFIFQLSPKNQVLTLHFMNQMRNQKIHFANELVLDTMVFGRSYVQINLDNSNRGTVPAKLPIFDLQSTNMGILFLQYQVIKTEVTHIVQKLKDYQYMLKMSVFRILFHREPSSVQNFYFKFICGNNVHKENFVLEEFEGRYIYNYPVTLYLKDEKQIQIETQIKDKYKKDYRNPNTSFETESNYSKSVKSKKKVNKKNLIDLSNVDKLVSIFDLNFKKNLKTHVKLPLNIVVKNTQRQIGFLEFDVDVMFKTKKEKEELQIQKKRELELKNKSKELQKPKKKEKKYEIPKNGTIVINSIIGKLELFNEQAIKDKNISIEAKLGKIPQLSTILQNPGKELIWMDTWTFKRTWEENIKFIVNLHISNDKKLPYYYSEVNIRDLFQKGRYMAKRLQLKDGDNNYCGSLTIDMTYEQEQEKPREIPKKKSIQIKRSPEQLQLQRQEKKRKQIAERMQRREQEKRRREQEIQNPPYSQNELFLPPLRSSRNTIQNKRTLDPKRSVNQSVNVYNKGGVQVFSKSPRFHQDKTPSADLFFYRPASDFEPKGKKGPVMMGYGEKYDFTKQHEDAPGVGRYEIPSTWDKYK